MRDPGDTRSDVDPRAQTLIAFIGTTLLKDDGAEIRDDTPLVSSGILDSFALVEMIQKLEEVTGCRIPSGRIGPADLETVQLMLPAADRLRA
jgi:acyl carrier protein